MSDNRRQKTARGGEMGKIVFFILILIHALCILLFCKITNKSTIELIYKLLGYYMFRHYRVIFRQLVFLTSPNYIRISIAAVGNTI